MGRKTAITSQAAPAEKTGTVAYDNVFTSLGARAVSALAPHTVPWIAGGAMLPVGMGTHALWGDPGTLPWVTAGMTLSGVALTGVTWMVSRYRHVLGRVQSTGTTAVASGWLLAATIAGPTSRPTLDIGLWLGGTLAAAWNIRNVIRMNEPGQGEAGALPSGPSLFKRLLTETAAQAGREIGGVKQITQERAAIQGTVELVDGDTAGDLARATPSMESLAGLPPGSIKVNENPRNAGEATVIVSNPLILDDPVPWPGPSRPGGSPADPLHCGMFQDGSPAEFVLVGAHGQVMGMTGAAKTTAGMWGVIGEWITREETATAVVDITKQGQSTEPCKDALHYVVDSKAKARKFFNDLERVAQKRLAHLAQRRLIAWEPGCGLSYLLVWIEEAADVFDNIDMDTFVNLARMLRSAGGSFVWSLQRADHTQMPTIVKGQGGGKICFGVESPHDAKWGLTEEQEDQGAAPDKWKARQPGMAYMDVQGVPASHIALPMRWHDWGRTNAERVARFAAHCANYPAAARPVDPITAELFVPPAPSSAAAAADDEELDVKNVHREYATPDDELDGADATQPPVDPEAPLQEVQDIPLGGGQKMPPEQARAFLNAELAKFGDRPFRPKDLKHVLQVTGMGRTWVQNQLRAKVDAGELDHDEDAGEYRVPVLTAA
ncbi:hypothetical protein [Nonomuraea gerenzanensis]|uniref:Putative sporulation-related protein n=1 Tax=Nonomuraea gerenzanensis TaxID=93944 RepID=A0A1M4BL13_9ACTN|nr:hypothetical protein [Nonomuraea gerenzanensis]UBU19195.1 hypothetical protein LCN96_56345 [Nonomuraea gerenzanensis]SAP16356.1 putative sporulation-related protein [Nonomuraea gerenzanensis]